MLWDAKEVLRNPHATANDFENVEIRYRQFKKNFEEKRDWESAGDFYHGEMLMRLKKYCAERVEKSSTPPGGADLDFERDFPQQKQNLFPCAGTSGSLTSTKVPARGICLGTVILVSSACFFLFFFTLSARIPEQNTISLSYLTELLRRQMTRGLRPAPGDEIRYDVFLKNHFYSVYRHHTPVSLPQNEEANIYSGQ